MNTIIIYRSKTGFTERYAKWIAEALSADLLPYERRESADFSRYDTVVYGGGFHAGTINGLAWLKKQLPTLRGKKIAVFCTGATPAESPMAAQALSRNFTPEEQKVIRAFYLQSGLNYEKMGAADKLLMSLFRKMMSGKKEKNGEEAAMGDAIQQSYDVCSRDKIQPLVEYLQKQD